MRKTKAYYTTGQLSESCYTVQKLDPYLKEAGKPYFVNFTGSGHFCSCMATISDCRHYKMVQKFIDEGKIGKHAPYDYDNDRFHQLPSYLLEV